MQITIHTTATGGEGYFNAKKARFAPQKKAFSSALFAFFLRTIKELVLLCRDLLFLEDPREKKASLAETGKIKSSDFRYLWREKDSAHSCTGKSYDRRKDNPF